MTHFLVTMVPEPSSKKGCLKNVGNVGIFLKCGQNFENVVNVGPLGTLYVCIHVCVYSIKSTDYHTLYLILTFIFIR